MEMESVKTTLVKLVDAFTEKFTVERFADVLFSQMLSALLRQDYDTAAIEEIVNRTLY